ncbi:DUF393 domain-containing protein [Chloroflexi bacterium TSY]|nr:DUF393 domain-containing protein [Chloroflexi bacterium TSY]
MKNSTILFDGVCNLCTWSVQFIIQRDPEGVFRFASLQSAAGQELLARHGLSQVSFDSLVLVKNGNCYTESDAALRIAHGLSGMWPLLYHLLWIPRPIRNWCYRFIAQNRYRLFGKAGICMIPSPGISSRFIQDEV